ncbi:MAG: M67 family metallopeptidase [Blastocatellia bacterium]
MTLRMDKALADEIARLGERGYPNEVCGLLLGRFEAGADRTVTGLFPLDNERVDSRTNRYAVSAGSMLAGERHATRAGLDVVGYYHSHPDAPAEPSGYDLEHATWPGVSYPIVSVRQGTAAGLRSWTLADDRLTFEEEPISTDI